VMRRRVVEANGATDEARRRAAPAVPQDCVPVADVLVVEVMNARSRDARLARKPMALTVRDERKKALSKGFAALGHEVKMGPRS